MAISLLATAAAGPADVHSIQGTVVVSPADPQTMYRGIRNLSVSHDAGQTWERVGLPGTVNDLAGSGRNRDTLYAASDAGLLISRDGGHSWSPLIAGNPATIVEVTPQGYIYAFLIKRGLVRSTEQPLRFLITKGMASSSTSRWHGLRSSTIRSSGAARPASTRPA
jgi:hypothetical protein